MEVRTDKIKHMFQLTFPFKHVVKIPSKHTWCQLANQKNTFVK